MGLDGAGWIGAKAGLLQGPDAFFISICNPKEVKESPKEAVVPNRARGRHHFFNKEREENDGNKVYQVKYKMELGQGDGYGVAPRTFPKEWNSRKQQRLD